MSLRRLPPVRSAVPLVRWSAERGLQRVQQEFPNHRVWLCRSGTDALAAAIQFAKLRKHVHEPEVILPAYGCPDLVAACFASGVAPRLVDIVDSSWKFDRSALLQSVSGRTVAILAVNLLGLGDDAAALQRVTESVGATLIQDSAQHVPFDSSSQISNAPIVLSFGRGKPANALGGGALLLPLGAEPFDAERMLARPTKGERRRDAIIGSRLVSGVFNLVTAPLLYGLVSRLPGFDIGGTAYCSLDRIAALPASAWRRIGPAFDAHAQSHSCFAQWMRHLAEFEECDIAVLEPAVDVRSQRMLRLPALARDRRSRDAIVDALKAHGLGASEFYGVALNEVAGVPEHVRSQGPFPGARRFAERLFTLPTHRFVDEATASKVIQIVRVAMQTR